MDTTFSEFSGPGSSQLTQQDIGPRPSRTEIRYGILTTPDYPPAFAAGEALEWAAPAWHLAGGPSGWIRDWFIPPGKVFSFGCFAPKLDTGVNGLFSQFALRVEDRPSAPIKA